MHRFFGGVVDKVRTYVALRRLDDLDPDFKAFFEYIRTGLGIVPTSERIAAMKIWCAARLKYYGYTSMEPYLSLLASPDGYRREIPTLLETASGRHSDFFRQPGQFEPLSGILAEAFERKGPYRPVTMWSAGCATGEEAYTMALVAATHMARAPEYKVDVMGSDISADALDVASKAVYPEEKVLTVPVSMRKRFFMRSKDRARKVVKVGTDVRDLVRFENINLLESFEYPGRFDVIYCRDTLTYLDLEARARAFGRLVSHLGHMGVLITGKSENLSNLGLPIRQTAPGTYVSV